MIHNDLHMMPPTTSFTVDHDRHKERMDREYRYERHIFDLSCKFFLFGRERTIDALRLDHTGSVYEARQAATWGSYLWRLFGAFAGRNRNH